MLSLSARRAWIEIHGCYSLRHSAPSLSARRAWIEIPAGCWRDARRAVALRKESVDRNDAVQVVIVKMYASLSARRAWIEICGGASGKLLALVALRKESVDRNRAGLLLGGKSGKSLSARRAWIEIAHGPVQGSFCFCRSPQGERG